MADENTPGSGAPGAQGGAGATGGKVDSTNTQNQGKTVSWEDHQRVLTDMHKFKTELADAKKQIDDKANEALQKNGDYQKLYDQEKAKVADLTKQLKDVIAFNANTHRLNEVKAAAATAGLRKEAVKDLELLDLSALPVELTSRNRYIVEGVGSFVDGLKVDKPHWFQNLNAPAVNTGGGAPPPPTGKITAADVAQAEIDARKGKITKAEYHAKHEAYVKQSKAS